jgi:TRAP-type C4-dicarboxylate transport system substrate-binding protein
LTFKTYEVQKYLSVTNHQWTGLWLTVNPDAWKALPPDVQAIVTRNARKYALDAGRNVEIQSASVRDRLARGGLAINDVDVAPFKALLGAYYAHWKSEFGPTAWGLLEKYVGPLG